MRFLCLLLASFWTVATTAAANDDPNRAVREALQSELEPFDAIDWQTPTPARGPALEGYRARVIKVAGDAQWNPNLRAGSIAFPRGARTERLGVTVYQPEGTPAGTLLFVHGYMSHAANFAYTFEFFSQRGWRVVTLDLPGHGLSTGPRADIDSFAEYGDAVRTWLDWAFRQSWEGPRILLAHSLGSAASLEALRRPGAPHLDRIVFCAPLLRVVWHPALQFGDWAFSWWLKQIPTTFGWDGYLDGYVMPVHWFQELDRWLGDVRNQAPLNWPLTIYTGDHDTVVDAAWNRSEYQRLVPGARIVVLGGKDHLFLSNGGDRVAFHRQLAADLGLAQ